MTSLISVRARMRLLGAAALLLGVATLSGCGRRAVMRDVRDRPAVLETGMNASSEATHSAIVKALRQRGYAIESDDGRVIVASVTSGDVWARMRIEAADGRYSITHADSSPELLYDPDRGTVHRRYNRWVRKLQGTIDDRLRETEEIASARPVAVPAVAPRREAPRSVEVEAQPSEPSPSQAGTPSAGSGLPPDYAPLPDHREPVGRPPGAIDI